MEESQGADPRQAGGYGPTLAAAVPVHGPLPPRSVLAMGARLADTLSAAHDAGIIHPGLSPASVLLAPEGPRLIGSGVSQAAYREQAAPAGALPGLPGFTPPERAAGLEAGPASDMFSLGAVLLYAATGAWMSYFAVHLDQLPRELRPFIERCLAADPGRRPTAAEFRTVLAAAHPEAFGPAAWPGGIPARAATPYGVWPAPGSAPAPATTREPAPRKPRKPRKPREPRKPQEPREPREPRKPWKLWSTPKTRRRAGVIATAALAFAVAAVGAVYVIHPWPYPVLSPAGLTADQQGTTSISLNWSSPASGPLPDKYVILCDGAVAATVPGTVNHFKYGGLTPATTYDFRVIAYRGSASSQPSTDLRAATEKPALSQAVFNSSVYVTEKLKSGGSEVTGDTNGDTWYDPWTFMSQCTVGPCATQLSGQIEGQAFTAVLRPAGGGSYTGTAHINDFYYCGNSQSNNTDSTLVITARPVTASAGGSDWQVSKFTGTIIWDVEANPNGGCGSATLDIGISS